MTRRILNYGHMALEEHPTAGRLILGLGLCIGVATLVLIPYRILNHDPSFEYRRPVAAGVLMATGMTAVLVFPAYVGMVVLVAWRSCANRWMALGGLGAAVCGLSINMLATYLGN